MNTMNDTKRSSRRPIIVIVVGLIVLISIASGVDSESDTNSPRASSSSPRPTVQARATSVPQPAVSSDHSVEYKITMTDSNSMALTYQNAQGGTEQMKAAGRVWTKTFRMEPGDFAYISAQNQRDSGGVMCEIYVDGKLWKTSTSDGGYTIASCSGSVGLD